MLVNFCHLLAESPTQRTQFGTRVMSTAITASSSSSHSAATRQYTMWQWQRCKLQWLTYTCLLAIWIGAHCPLATGLDYYTVKPSFVPSCKIYEPEFTKCSTESVQKLINQLSIGIPDFSASFGPFDPMHVRDIIFKQDNNEIATIRANLSSVMVKGFSKIVVKESRVSKKDFGWQTKIYMPTMRLDANYRLDGRILLIPLTGHGTIFIEIDNLDILLFTKTRLYEKGGFTFYNVTNVRVADLSMTRVRTYLDNLFNGRNKEIERSTNRFFNQNWRDFYEALKPIIIETVENILFEILHKVFEIIPANFFVEDIPTSAQLYGRSGQPAKRPN